MGDWNFENVPGCIPDELEPFFEPESYHAVNTDSSCDTIVL